MRRRRQRLLAAGAVVLLAVVGTQAAWAASLGVTSAKLGASAPATPVMYPVSVATANNGNQVGLIQKNDTVTWVWSRPVDLPTLCSGWSNASSTYSLSMSWTVQNNTGTTGNDVLVAGATGATCANGLHVGAVDLGSNGYVTADVTWTGAGTDVTVGASTTTLVLTFPVTGSGSPDLATVGSGTAAAWTPDPLTADLSARTCGANRARSSATVHF